MAGGAAVSMPFGVVAVGRCAMPLALVQFFSCERAAAARRSFTKKRGSFEFVVDLDLRQQSLVALDGDGLSTI